DCFLFFFQAEDGIRDFHVTGVQTCALPISRQHHVEQHDVGAVTLELAEGGVAVGGDRDLVALLAQQVGQRVAVALLVLDDQHPEIGRASCREGGKSGALGGAVQKECKRKEN